MEFHFSSLKQTNKKQSKVFRAMAKSWKYSDSYTIYDLYTTYKIVRNI